MPPINVLTGWKEQNVQNQGLFFWDEGCICLMPLHEFSQVLTHTQGFIVIYRLRLFYSRGDILQSLVAGPNYAEWEQAAIYAH